MPWTHCLIVAVALLCAGNARTELSRPAKHRMRQHVEDLRTIERHLLQGELPVAKVLAFMLTRPIPGIPRSAEARAVSLTAATLSNAQTIEDAIRAEVRVAAACAACHEAQNMPALKLGRQAPRDLPTVEAQMARHQWATDRLWIGLVIPSESHWKSGLYVLAHTNLPMVTVEHSALGQRLRDQAADAYARPAITNAGRADTYAEILLTCWGCHANHVTRR